MMERDNAAQDKKQQDKEPLDEEKLEQVSGGGVPELIQFPGDYDPDDDSDEDFHH